MALIHTCFFLEKNPATITIKMVKEGIKGIFRRKE